VCGLVGVGINQSHQRKSEVGSGKGWGKVKGTGSASLKDQWYQCGLRITPIVEMKLIEGYYHRDFVDPENFVTCTLLGSLSQYNIGVGSSGTRVVWSGGVANLEKVNCMRSNGTHIAVGGFSNGGKGLVEVYGA